MLRIQQDPHSLFHTRHTCRERNMRTTRRPTPWLVLFSRSALFVGLVLRLRPRLLPYSVIVHALMDDSTLSV